MTDEDSYSSDLVVDGVPVEPPAGSSLHVSGAAPQVVEPASFPPSGSHAFTPQAPYWSFGDNYGSGTEQITYKSMTEAWGYQDSAYIVGLADGPVTETADLFCGGSLVAHYGGHLEPATYHFHGSKGGLNTSCVYHTTVVQTFATTTGGKATFTAKWNWYLTLVF